MEMMDMPMEEMDMDMGEMDMGEMDKMDDMGDWMEEAHGKAMMEAQITFTLVSLMSAGVSALQLFRYRSGTFYTVGAADTTLYKYNDLVRLYGGLVFWSLAALFQLLSWGGIATDINMMIWMVGHEVGAFMTLAYFIMNWYLYEANYSTCAANSDDTCDVASMVLMDTAEVAAHEAMISFELYHQHEAWGMAQWMKMSPEKQAAFKEDKYDDDKDDDEEWESEEAKDADDVVMADFHITKMFKFVHF